MRWRSVEVFCLKQRRKKRMQLRHCLRAHTKCPPFTLNLNCVKFSHTLKVTRAGQSTWSVVFRILDNIKHSNLGRQRKMETARELPELPSFKTFSSGKLLSSVASPPNPVKDKRTRFVKAPAILRPWLLLMCREIPLYPTRSLVSCSCVICEQLCTISSIWSGVRPDLGRTNLRHFQVGKLVSANRFHSLQTDVTAQRSEGCTKVNNFHKIFSDVQSMSADSCIDVKSFAASSPTLQATRRRRDSQYTFLTARVGGVVALLITEYFCDAPRCTLLNKNGVKHAADELSAKWNIGYEMLLNGLHWNGGGQSIQRIE